MSAGTLAAQESLPEGEGRATVVKVCSGCHEAGIVAAKRMAKADWSDLVDEMREKGANATDADAQAIVAYLAKYFGPDEKKTSPPPQTHDDK